MCTHAYAVSNHGLDSLLNREHDFTIGVDEMLVNHCESDNNLCYLARGDENDTQGIKGNGLFYQDERDRVSDVGDDIFGESRLLSAVVRSFTK